MGLLKGALIAVWPPLLALSCEQPEQRPDCARACATLSDCGLLPSALGTGLNARANCTERCRLSDERVADPVVQCYREAARDERVDWCRAESSCPVLAECLAERFPGEDPTGVGFVEVQVGVARASIATDPDECGGSDGPDGFAVLDTRDPMACAAVGVLDLTLFPVPGARPTRVSDRQRSCPDALSASFSPIEARAGAYQAKLKLIGPGPAPATFDTLDAGLLDAGDASVDPPAPATVTCRILRSRPLGIPAGETTRVNLSIPLDWATSSFLDPCEANCFDTVDNDGDGLPDCSDPACQSECSKCRLTLAENGRLVPDCNEPTCPCFTQLDAGSARPSAAPAQVLRSDANDGDASVDPAPAAIADAGDSGAGD